MEELSVEELVDRSGATAEQLRRLGELGIITPTPEGRYRRSDIQRIRVVEALAEAGFAPDQLGQLIAVGAYDLDWASVVFPEPTAQLTTPLEQATAATGLPEDLARRLYDAWELPRPQPGQALRADEDELLQLAAPALAAFGRDETSLLAMHRQLGESLRRLAESQVRLFHTHVDQQLGAEGEPDRAWTDDLNQVAAWLMASLERTVVLLYRRHFEHYVLDVTVLRAEAALERAGLARRRPDRPPAIAFLDLSGYTKLTEERGDRAAAELAARLVEIVHELAHRHGGRPQARIGLHSGHEGEVHHLHRTPPEVVGRLLFLRRPSLGARGSRDSDRRQKRPRKGPIGSCPALWRPPVPRTGMSSSWCGSLNGSTTCAPRVS